MSPHQVRNSSIVTGVGPRQCAPTFVALRALLSISVHGQGKEGEGVEARIEGVDGWASRSIGLRLKANTCSFFFLYCLCVSSLQGACWGHVSPASG